MRKNIQYSLLTILLLFLAILFTGCPLSPLTDLEAEQGQGTLSLMLKIPNYDLHEGENTVQKAIAPHTAFVDIYLNGKMVFHLDLANDPNDPNDQSVNQVSDNVWGIQVSVAAKTYSLIEVRLLDDQGTVLTSGAATNVTVSSDRDNTTPILISLVPHEDIITPLTVGLSLGAQAVSSSGMVFFSFPATADTGYDITLNPSSGQPDLYLFDPDGRRTGYERGTDYGYTEGVPVTITKLLDRTDTYYIAVYGWNASADFTIEVVVNSNPPSSGPSSEAVDYLEEAIDSATQENFDSALNSFSLAVAADPNYGPALVGYHAFDLFSITIDPDIVDTAVNTLGVADYPDSMNALFSNDWLEEIVMNKAIESTETMFLPNITGQEDCDGIFGDEPDGIINAPERGVAMLEFFVTHSSGFNTLFDPIITSLNSRLDAIIDSIQNLDPGMSISFSPDIFSDEMEYFDPFWATYMDWPTDDHGNALEITIGRAELLIIASQLQILQSILYMIQVYDFDLNDPDSGASLLPDYWDAYNPFDGTAWGDSPSYPGVSPALTNLLRPRTDSWQTSMAAAKDSFVGSLTNLKTAFQDILTDRDGFLASSGSPFIALLDMGDPNNPSTSEGWAIACEGLNVGINVADELLDSIEDPNAETLAILPLAMDPNDIFSYADANNWPTQITPGSSIGINLGVLFTDPLANLFEMETNGEPAWYKFDIGAEGLVPASSIDPMHSSLAFMRGPDISLGGLIPLENIDYIPRDDPNTKFDIDLSFDDVNGNSKWDPNETIHEAEFRPEVEGIIDITSGIDDGYEGDPVMFYNETDAPILEATDADLAKLTDGSTIPDLRNALAGLGSNYIDRYGSNHPLFFLDGSEAYFPVPASGAWHSLTPAGTSGVDHNGDPIVSCGSVWWMIGEELFENFIPPTPGPTSPPSPGPGPRPRPRPTPSSEGEGTEASPVTIYVDATN